MFNNLLHTFETSPKIEFNSISAARWLIRLPPSGGFFRKKFYRKKLRYRFFSSKILKQKSPLGCFFRKKFYRKKLRFRFFGAGGRGGGRGARGGPRGGAGGGW